MPRDLVQRIDLDLLVPPFVERLLAVLAECRERGADYFAISGFRSDKEQMALYFQGRTAPGPRVTNALAGESPHQFGLAVDLARDADTTRAGLQPTWAPGTYDLLGEVAKAHGLVWGGDFRRPDQPHIQWPGYVTAGELAELRRAWLGYGDAVPVKERLKDVWSRVG
jgi:peptidoglycan L-alanyl-D-glutamate endopeptidase CwlK